MLTIRSDLLTPVQNVFAVQGSGWFVSFYVCEPDTILKFFGAQWGPTISINEGGVR